MADRAHDASSFPDIRSDCLQALRGRIVIERGVPCGREENSIVSFL